MAFVGASGWANPERYAPADAQAVWFAKVLTVVAPDATVTITVVESARRFASLLYHDNLASASASAPVSVGQGRVEQAFHACPARSYPDGTQFNGGFVVQGRRCVPLDLRVGGQRATRVVLSFGAGRCP